MDEEYKFTEIYKLKEMLEIAKIPFVFTDRSVEAVMYKMPNLHLEYPVSGITKGRVCSVIQSTISYGRESDLLEIQGLLTEEEMECDSVAGYLTAENVFSRIYKHYLEGKLNG